MVRTGHTVGQSTIAYLRRIAAGGAVDIYISFLVDEAEKPPPLQRIDRMVIRNRLTAVNGGRSILKPIDRLPAPIDIHLYLMLSGRFHDVETTPHLMLSGRFHDVEITLHAFV